MASHLLPVFTVEGDCSEDVSEELIDGNDVKHVKGEQVAKVKRASHRGRHKHLKKNTHRMK